MMERIFCHPALLIFCLLSSLGLAWAWQIRNEEFAQLQPSHTNVDEIEVSPSLNWLQRQLGNLGKNAPKIRQDAFEGAETIGWELLDSTSALSVAAQCELARWSSPGRLPLHTQSVAISKVEGHPALELKLQASGAEPEVLAWLDHLLHAPINAGYLTDPGQVHLETEDKILHLTLAVRVWPAAAFLRHTLSKETP